MRLSSHLALCLYRAATTVLAPPAALWIKWRRRRDPPYGARLLELLGWHRVNLPWSICFHCASVGEVLSLRPLLRELCARHPKLPLVLTTLTTTGAAAAAQIPGITVLYAPLDSPLAVRGLFNAIHPKALFILDTELWPALLASAHARHLPVVIINARMQERNLRRYLRFPKLSADLLGARLTAVACVSEADARRFKTLGARSGAVTVCGNLKYDLRPDEQLFTRTRIYHTEHLKGPVLGAISTHDGEEELLLESYFTLLSTFPDLSLVLVPRHPSGVARARAFMKRTATPYTLRDQAGAPADFKGGILLGATMGEIEFYFGLCDLIFMGGSLVPHGGHNPLEPAYFSLPVITGPWYHNFQEQFERLIDVGGAYLAPDHRRLCTLVQKLLKDPETLDASGVKAMEVQQEGRGALRRALELIERFIPEADGADRTDRIDGADEKVTKNQQDATELKVPKRKQEAKGAKEEKREQGRKSGENGGNGENEEKQRSVPDEKGEEVRSGTPN